MDLRLTLAHGSYLLREIYEHLSRKPIAKILFLIMRAKQLKIHFFELHTKRHLILIRKPFESRFAKLQKKQMRCLSKFDSHEKKL